MKDRRGRLTRLPVVICAYRTTSEWLFTKWLITKAAAYMTYLI